jgi:prephenate dehydrogenase
LTTETHHPHFERIAILGLGLLGGSWGLALKKRGYPGRVAGYARHPETRDQAQRLGAVDECFSDPADAARAADLVIVATPVGTILDLLPLIRQYTPAHALITDVGSTKVRICNRACQVFFSNPLFLGAHPMAGKEHSGLEHADSELFVTARYVLTPLRPDDAQDSRVKAFSKLVEWIGARPFVIDAVAHDRAVAAVSHLPQLLSTALASLASEQVNQAHLPLELAATGFRDVTRLADSSYAIWRDICLTNRENIVKALDAFIGKLEEIKLHLADRDLQREFRQAVGLRAELRRIQ